MKRCLDLILRVFVVVGLVAVMSGAAVAQKTAKQCRDEWRANEAANKAKGITESAFVKECRAAAAQPGAPAAAPTAATAAAGGQKTAKQCRDEWRANEAANKAKGITESAFVKECRAGTTTAAQPAAPGAAPAATAAAHKTAKECRDEWRANEAENKKNGITESAFVKDCRAGTTTARPAATAAPTAAPSPRAAAPAAPAPAQTAAPTRNPAPTVGAAPTGANQFTSEAAAKTQCRSDLVVWVNNDSHIYHFSGHSDYGHTKEGAYMCEKAAMAAGNRAAKNEKHP